MNEHAFPRENRLLHARDFSGVFDATEVKAPHPVVLALASSNGLTHHRLGLIVAKKHVRLAVQRNRIKRVCREFFRHCPPGVHNLDVVLLARKGIDQLDNETLSTILRRQWTKLTRSLPSRAD